MIPTYQMDVLGLRALTQQGIARMINEGARNLHTPLQGAESYARYSGNLDTPEKVKLHLVRMGAGGDGAYASLMLLATKNPYGLADFLPDDNAAKGLQKSLPIADFSREQPGFNHGMPQFNMNDGRPQEKKYHRNSYSYAKYARIAYLKSAAKALYGKAGSEIANAMAKIRGVYQSSKGFLRRNKEYKGQDNAQSNVVSLDAYRAAREHKKYTSPDIPSATLEQKVA